MNLTEQEMQLIREGKLLQARDAICKRCPDLRSREAEDLIQDYEMALEVGSQS